MSENDKPMVNEEVLNATIVPAASQNALNIFEKREEKASESTKQVVTTTTTTTVTTVTSAEQQQVVNSVSSAEVDKSAVFEKQNKKMIVLGSIEKDGVKHHVKTKQSTTKGRSVSPRDRKPSPRAQRQTETPQSVQSEDSGPNKVKEPSDKLLKNTASRVRDLQVLEERKKEKEPTYVSPAKRKSLENSWTPSERLLRPTQSRIMDVKEWSAHKERAKYEDDIWWELRKPAETAKTKPDTPSKLFEPTASFSKTVRPKYDAVAAAAAVESPPKEVHHIPAKIDQNSPLLKSTTAAKLNTWKQTEIVPEQPKPVLQLTSAQSGPQHVQSKLTYDTKATQLNRWKSKEQIEREKEKEKQVPANPNAKKVKEVSPRLLERSECLKNSVKPKYEKSNVDPREVGWNTVRRTSIPTIEEMHDSLVRSSGSVISSQRDSSGSAFNSREHEEDGHHPHHDEENHLEPDQESHEIQSHEDPITHEEQEHHYESNHTVTVEQATTVLTHSIQTLEVSN